MERNQGLAIPLPVARKQSLKVFRTPIGFHDAYVAAPSQKAALAIWGAESNLFATGAAERVDDPELSREPLAKPGEVVRRLRGTLDEHMAALPKRPTPKPAREIPEGGIRPKTKAKAKPRPRPSRAALDRAEAALSALEARQEAARAELARRQAELDEARRALDAKLNRESDKLRQRMEAAREKFNAALSDWRKE